MPAHAQGFIVALGLLAAIVSPGLAAKDDTLRAWPAGRPTPSLQLNDLDGQGRGLAEFRGKVVVVNFWATWCDPCVEELAFLNALADAERGKLAVLGVNFKEPASRIRKFRATQGLAYPILLDESGERFGKWAGGILPTTVLIDRKGKARWRIVGALDASDRAFKQALEQLLKE